MVTLRLGGYPGEDNIDGSANVCSDNSAVNLLNFIGSSEEDKIQDFNGIWEEIPLNHTGLIYDDFYFDAYSAGAGIYEFSYTVENADGCPSRSVRLLLEVHKNPSIGTSEPIVVCSIDDLSGLTNVDLHDYLTDEDMNGVWSETDTGQLSGQGDSIIDIKAINQNLGPGSYEFTYGIYDAHPSCQSIETSVN